MPLAVITIADPATPLSTQAQEVALIARGLDLAARSIRGAGGAQTAGDIVDTGANVIGSWTYTPVASS
jgi:hypothetical protein